MAKVVDGLGSNGITLVVGRYCYCNLVVVVVVVSPLGRSGPVKLLPCQLLVYRIRWKNQGREMALCILPEL